MDCRYRPKMSRLQRAKQFAPFDALDGLSLALEKVRNEHLSAERKQLSEDQYDDLNRRFGGIRRGDEITVVFYDDGEYRNVTGTFMGMDPETMIIKVGPMDIYADDVVDMHIR